MAMAKPWGSLASPAQNSPWKSVRSSHGMNPSEDSPFDTSSGLRFKKLHIKVQREGTSNVQNEAVQPTE